MKKGFLNKKPISNPDPKGSTGEKHAQKAGKTVSTSTAESFSSNAAETGSLTTLQNNLKKDLSAYRVERDQDGRVISVKHTHTAPKNTERREGYGPFEDSEITTKECPYRDDLPPDRLILAAVPQIRGVGPASDDHTWCQLPKKIYDRIFATPNFCLDVPGGPQDGTTMYKVTTIVGKDLGILATRDIDGGELVLGERPLLIAPAAKAGKDLFKSIPPHFTVEDVMVASLQENERHLELSLVGNMDPKKKEAFLALHNSHTTDGSGPLFGRLRTNGFGISSISHPNVSGNVRGGSDHTNTFTGVCEVGSRFNHSCTPNVAWEFDLRSFSFLFIAIRDIKAGEELTICYDMIDRLTTERNKNLVPYGFQCKCKRCVDPTESDTTLCVVGGNILSLSKALLQKVNPADAIRQAVLRLYNLAEQEGLHDSVFFLNSVELVIIVYQMLGDSQNAIRYSKIHASALRGNGNLYPATLLRHWADISSYRAFHECSPWWKAKAGREKVSWSSFKDFFDPEFGGLKMKTGLRKLVSHCVQAMLLKIPLADNFDVAAAAFGAPKEADNSAASAKEPDAIDIRTLIDVLRSMKKTVDPDLKSLFDSDRSTVVSESEVVRFLAVKLGFIMASGGTKDERNAKIQELIRRTGNDGSGIF